MWGSSEAAHFPNLGTIDFKWSVLVCFSLLKSSISSFVLVTLSPGLCQYGYTVSIGIPVQITSCVSPPPPFICLALQMHMLFKLLLIWTGLWAMVCPFMKFMTSFPLTFNSRFQSYSFLITFSNQQTSQPDNLKMYSLTMRNNHWAKLFIPQGCV